MRGVGVVLLVAVAVTGCGVRTGTVPGPAAPLTATASPTTSPTTSPTASPTTPASSTTPTAFRNVSMAGFGLSITFPVPDAWTLSRSQTDTLTRTDVKVGDDVLLRVDLTAREPGTARAGAEAAETRIKPLRPNYRRLGLADVDGAGDDAVDWTFSYDLDGTPARVIDRQIASGPGGVAVYLRAPARDYARYLPVWQRTARELSITTS
jgi:hypothetical protein